MNTGKIYCKCSNASASVLSMAIHDIKNSYSSAIFESTILPWLAHILDHQLGTLLFAYSYIPFSTYGDRYPESFLCLVVRFSFDWILVSCLPWSHDLRIYDCGIQHWLDWGHIEDRCLAWFHDSDCPSSSHCKFLDSL